MSDGDMGVQWIQGKRNRTEAELFSLTGPTDMSSQDKMI